DHMELWALGSKSLSGTQGPWVGSSRRGLKRSVAFLGPKSLRYNDPSNVARPVMEAVQTVTDDTIQNCAMQGLRLDQDSEPLVAQRSYASALAPNKKPRIDNGNTAWKVPDITVVPSENSGGAYSTPHFRMSSGMNGFGRLKPDGPVYIVSGREPGPDLAEEGFYNSPDFEGELCKHGGFLEESVMSRPDFHPPLQFPSSPLEDKSCSGACDSPPGTLDSPVSVTRENVLEGHPLTLRERIHQIGNQMRASATANIARFEPSIQLPSISFSDSRRDSQFRLHGNSNQATAIVFDGIYRTSTEAHITPQPPHENPRVE
ncbi:hypothetical protein BGX28_007687, partial [Mortierella sp. GBA30]